MTNTSNLDSPAREVEVELTLSLNFSLTHGDLKALADDGKDISEDDFIAELLGNYITEDDTYILQLIEQNGCTFSDCKVKLRLPQEE